MLTLLVAKAADVCQTPVLTSYFIKSGHYKQLANELKVWCMQAQWSMVMV